jgi:hypothetical protein
VSTAADVDQSGVLCLPPIRPPLLRSLPSVAALSPARCPRLRTLHVNFVSHTLEVSEGEVRERLPVLASGGVVNLIVSNSIYLFSI